MVDEMKAGKELDALIAPLVGLIRSDTGPYWVNLNCSIIYPSQSVDGAMWVLDAWEGDYEIRRQNDQYRVELFRPSEEFEAWGESLPLAVCRARLMAAQRDGQCRRP